MVIQVEATSLEGPIDPTPTGNGVVVGLLNEITSAVQHDSDGSRMWDGADRLLLEVLFAQSLRGSSSVESEGVSAEAVLLMNDTSGVLLRVLRSWGQPAMLSPRSGLPVGKDVLVGLEAERSWGPPALRSPLGPIGDLETFSDDVRVSELCKPFSDENPRIRFVPSTAQPQNPTLVLLRVSPIEAILRAQINLLVGFRDRGVRFTVMAAGLDRLLPPKTKLLLSSLGPTQTLPGAHKSHAFVCHVNQDTVVNQRGRGELGHAAGGSAVTRLPADGVMPVEVGGTTLSFATGPYAFSVGRLDLGSRLLIEAVGNAKTLGQTADGLPGRVADLACGNGVVGVMAHLRHRFTSLYFSDVSISSVALAQQNAKLHGVQHAEFAADTGFDHYRGPRFDAILLNPPFHQHAVVDEELGAQLFASAYGQLRVGGELWVVGNRHLGYQKTLRTMFGQCRLVTAHPKFVVLVAQRGATRLRPAKPARRQNSKGAVGLSTGINSEKE
jgi:Methyltransferase small domain